MKDILSQINYGFQLSVLIGFIVFVLAILIMKGAIQCLKRSK